MPHHAALKESSSTTKLRVVFNASAPSSTGVSLNDIMLVGPVIQPDLITVLIRFRCFVVAIITDIAKMYRQIKVKNTYQGLQRILWRDSPTENIKCLQLSRVTYGTASASFLAVRCLLKLVEDEGISFPLASRAIELNSYVDDILTGAEDFDGAVRVQDELIALLGKGQFKLHKWYSNHEDVLNKIPEENREKCSFHFSDGCSSIKTLGLVWNPVTDVFQIMVPHDLMGEKITKREILSSIAKLFDPLGLIAPVCVSAKIVMQLIWRAKLDWDDKVPSNILEIWIRVKMNLFELRKLIIPRLILTEHAVRFELHGFADSSTKAYGCAIYLKSVGNNGYSLIRLICAKSRVAPIRPVSLPRLELCACLLLARFMQVVCQALSVKIKQSYFWTDSMIALAWIRSDASRWNVFVANRVSEIQELCSNECWNHVVSSENPADIVSRGIDPGLLSASELWWKGPPWLGFDKMFWPVSVNLNDIEDPPEGKSVVCSFHISQNKANDFLSWFETFSSFYRLQRSFAYASRFCFNSKLANKNCRRSGFLKVSELTESFNTIFKIVQQQYFSKEIMLLNKGKDDPNFLPNLKSSKLKFLNPFIDKEGILRVGGRLNYCLIISTGQKFPIIIPPDNHVTKLLIIWEHKRLLHDGPQSTLVSLRNKVWLINGRNKVRQVIHQCVRCYRFAASPLNQTMADLPSVRVSPTRPFLHVGLDYGGPIAIKQSRIRKSLITKGYICLFVCMVTKALHLELVSDMSTKSFLNALQRFIARRGRCQKIFSDNGATFRGANNELNELYKLLNEKTSGSLIHETMLKEGVEWNFIPPFAPHWGGLWEAGIRMVKFHLKRVVGTTTLTYEELNTTLCQIEGVINSRPLCPLSSDPGNFDCLTPGHFLINDSLTSLPEVDLTDIPINQLSFWNQIRHIKQTFWKRWSREYLNTLQQRSKWLQKSPNIKEGSLVLVKDDHAPPLHWPLAKVMEIIKSRDGLVRSIRIKNKDGNMYIRPITKVCPLPVN